MIKSMTGFGHGECSYNNKKIIVELKAVNHRYLDLSIKTPRGFAKFEGLIRNYLSNRLARGKIDVFVNYEENADSQYEIIYNENEISLEKLLDLYFIYVDVLDEDGNIVNSMIGVVSFLIGLSIALIVIAISWFAARPIVAIISLVVVAALIAGLVFYVKNNKKTTQTVEQK